MRISEFYERYQQPVYTMLRIVTGFLFLWHGSQKLFSLPPAGVRIPLYIIMIAGTVEFFGGFLVMTGLWTRWAAFICSGEMAYAYWTVHASHALLPLVNHGELAVLYSFLFLFIFFTGPGRFSLDSLIRKKEHGYKRARYWHFAPDRWH